MIICNIGMINRLEIHGQEMPDSLLERRSRINESERSVDPWTSLLRAVEKSKFGKKSFIGSRKRKITKVSKKNYKIFFIIDDRIGRTIQSTRRPRFSYLDVLQDQSSDFWKSYRVRVGIGHGLLAKLLSVSDQLCLKNSCMLTYKRFSMQFVLWYVSWWVGFPWIYQTSFMQFKVDFLVVCHRMTPD